MSREPCPTTVELRFAVDATEAPLAYPVVSYPDRGVVEQLDVELAGPGVLATLVLPVGAARSWAGELFGAVSVAYREAIGDPHALSDFELASLPPADSYDPGPGMVVVGEDNERPAKVRFHIALDIAGQCLSTAELGRPGRTSQRAVQHGPRRRLGRRAAGRASGLNPGRADNPDAPTPT